ncbi:hypothetical protein PM082_002046 [Marasmius tenuissimus]|nr:hypothetical protein PM082_002046 [Marasmius tenuissimus]
MATASFFSHAHEFNMHNAEFSHVNGNSTKNVNHNTRNITGSHNRTTTDNRNSGNRVTKTKYEHRDNRQMNSQTYQDNRRADMGAQDASSKYGRGYWTGKTQGSDPYYSPQKEQGYGYAPQPTQGQRYLAPAPPKSAPLLLDNTPHHDSDSESEEDDDSGVSNETDDSYSPEDKALSDQIMASMKSKPQYEYAPARHANGARSAPPFAESQPIPVQEASPPARYGSAARNQAHPREEEERLSHQDRDDHEVYQPTPVRVTQPQTQDWEQKRDEDTASLLKPKPSHRRTGSAAPSTVPSKHSKTESAHHTPARTPSPLPLPPPQVSHPAGGRDGNESPASASSNDYQPGNARRDLKHTGVPLGERVESINVNPGKVSGGKHGAAKTENQYEEAKRGKSWRRKLFSWRKEESKDSKQRF